MKNETLIINKQLKMIHNSFEERRNRHMAQYNLTSAQMELLMYLKFSEKKEIYQREIEKWFGLKNPTVTGILNRLEEKGFIVRKTNNADRRYRMIELTEKSNCMLEKISDEVEQMNEKIYSCMSEEECRQLSGLLERILNRLSEI